LAKPASGSSGGIPSFALAAVLQNVPSSYIARYPPPPASRLDTVRTYAGPAPYGTRCWGGFYSNEITDHHRAASLIAHPASGAKDAEVELALVHLISWPLSHRLGSLSPLPFPHSTARRVI
jgi:hypothetical protein